MSQGGSLADLVRDDKSYNHISMTESYRDLVIRVRKHPLQGECHLLALFTTSRIETQGCQ